MDISTTISFLLVAVVLTFAPGPDILFVTAKSLSAGMRAGICVAAGLVTGTFVHTTLAALGISLLIRNSPPAFACVKWGGVAYLCWLGAKALAHWRETPLAENPPPSPPPQCARNGGDNYDCCYDDVTCHDGGDDCCHHHAAHHQPALLREKSSGGASFSLYRTGVFMAALNPKLIIFFLAFFPQFVSADATNAPAQMFLLGVIFALQAFAVFSVVAFFAGKISLALRTRPKIIRALNVFTALVLFSIAAGVAFI
ncbi:MAG: LysE family translocator [Opitutae bacterium]|nr:LysE family translocator [Opitutae bacterium]